MVRNTYSAAPGFSEDVLEINCPVKAQCTIGENVNPVTLVVARGVENGNLFGLLVSTLPSVFTMGTYVSCLDKVSSDQKVLLIGRDLDVVGSNDGLSLVGIVESLDILQV